jgi:hypothetical protein
MTNKSCQKVAQRFECEYCDYATSKKSSFDKHNMTLKHHSTKNTKTLTKDSSNESCQSCSDEPDLYKCDCGKSYKHQSSLWNHKKKCTWKSHEKEVVATPVAETTNNGSIPIEVVMELLKQNGEFKELLKDQNKQMMDIIGKGGLGSTTNNTNTNSHNTTNKNRFNINFFLNEQCKDAMNIMDFVNTLQLQLSDLERVGELGYVKGISQIVVNKLKDLDIHKRPIHCSDLKRETMYVKDQDIWEKENERKDKLSKMIKQVAHKNQKQIGTWQEENPEYKDSESIQSEKYLKIVGESMNGLTNDDESELYTNKIIKNIAKEVTIKEE